MRNILRHTHFIQPVRTGENRDGVAWKKDDIDKFLISEIGVAEGIIGDPSFQQNPGLFIMERTLQTAIDETDTAFQQYDKLRSKFRAEIKNDVASVEASAKKISAEFLRIATALENIQRTYTSGEFVAAVANAERLARALESIQKLSSSKLTFAVIENIKEPHETRALPDL